MFFCIIPCPLWILSSSLFSFSCFFFLKNKKTKRIFISLQIVIQTGLVEIGEDSERPLAIIETHTDSGLGKKRFLNTTFEEVLNTIHTATSEGFPVAIIATSTCVYFLIFLSSIVGYSFVLWLLQTKTTTRVSFDVLHRQRSNCRRSIYGNIFLTW